MANIMKVNSPAVINCVGADKNLSFGKKALKMNPTELIHEADPDITEEWKWETAVWSHQGLICALGAFKTTVKMNFFQGAFLEDPHNLFNAGLDAKKTRAIDFHNGDIIGESALKDLIRAAVAHSVGGK